MAGDVHKQLSLMPHACTQCTTYALKLVKLVQYTGKYTLYMLNVQYILYTRCEDDGKFR